MLSVISIIFFSLASWLIILAGLASFKSSPRLAFIAIHYFLNIIIFGLAFLLHYKYFSKFTPFATMAIAMITLFAAEFIFWRFFYSGELWFLNFPDWLVPAFIAASAIYLTGVALK